MTKPSPFFFAAQWDRLIISCGLDLTKSHPKGRASWSSLCGLLPTVLCFGKEVCKSPQSQHGEASVQQYSFVISMQHARFVTESRQCGMWEILWQVQSCSGLLPRHVNSWHMPRKYARTEWRFPTTTSPRTNIYYSANSWWRTWF